MVHFVESSTNRSATGLRGSLALALRTWPMATSLICVETREVVRCEYCRLMQYRTNNSLCRRCHKPLDFEEPAQLAPQLVTSQPVPNSGDAGSQVAAQVRDMRRARHLSQRQLAGRMQVPRTYISKIENGKAIPTLGSLERLALALGVEVRHLVRDARSRRDEEVAAILSDPFLAELAPLAVAPGLAAPHALLRCATGRRHGTPAHRVEAGDPGNWPATNSRRLIHFRVLFAVYGRWQTAMRRCRPSFPRSLGLPHSLQRIGACATVKNVTPRTRPNVTVPAGDSFMRWPAASSFPA